MLHTLTFLCALTSPLGPELVRAPDARESSPVAQQQDEEFEKRRKAAGKDVDKLWDVYKWCKEQKKDDKGRSVLRQLLQIDPKHEEANLALGNVLYDGKWFPSQKKVDEYKKEQEGKTAKSDGLVDYKGKRVPPEDVPFLEKGLVKDDSGNWVDAEEFKRKQEGWLRQDLEWIKPDEKANIEKGLWKCGEKWLTLDEANKYHADLYTWWRLDCGKYRLYTTCERTFALEKLKPTLDRAWDDLVKAASCEPDHPPIALVFRDDTQYNTFAGGDQDADIPNTDLRGLSGVHYAFFSEVAAELDGKTMLAGAGYWDPTAKNGDAFGPHSVRLALGHSFVEALDPSPKAWEKARKAKTLEQGFLKDFDEEKRLSSWLRMGIAVYAERYFIDSTAKDKLWARAWSVSNIVKGGGLDPLKQILDGRLTPGDGTLKLMNEMGLLVAFAVDGTCAPVTEKFKVVQEKLKTGKDKKELSVALKAFTDELQKQETELRKFAGI